MNAPAFAPPRRHDGRLRLAIDDLAKLEEVGILDPDAKTELIDGELFIMADEGVTHIDYKSELVRWLGRNLPDAVRVVPDASLYLSDADKPRPDVYVCDATAALRPLDPAAIRLIVEIADSLLGRDLETKAELYGRYGVAEYWVVDIGARVTRVHRRPWNGRYPEPGRLPFSSALQAEFFPAAPALVISQLPRLG